MSNARIFNSRKRQLLRTHISAPEALSGIALLGALALMVGWIAAQGGNFDAADRDLPYEVLAAQPVEDRLYRLPLKTWVSPDARGRTGAVADSLNLGLFPASILSGGWAISSRPRQFDRSTLFQKINGEADKFIRQGFRELHYIALKAPRGGGEIAIELFDQGSFAGGLGIFSDHRTDDRAIRREGGALYYTTPVGAIGFRGRYFFRIAGNVESEAIRQKSSDLIRAFATLSGDEAAAPLPFRILTQGMGVDPGDIAYQRRNVFQYDFADDFWFGRASTESPARMFLHQAPSADAASTLFRNIAQEHATEFRVLERTKNTVLMRHEFLKTHFFMAVSGALIYGMENEPEPQRIRSITTRLATVVGKQW